MVLRKFIIGLIFATLAVGLSFADKKSEEFVSEYASIVLGVLNNPELSKEDRVESFNAYMDEFAFIDRVSRFVIGKYNRRFEKNEYDRYAKAFRDFTLAVYISELDQYRGSELIVHGSIDRKKNDSVVKTTLRHVNGDEMKVDWRVLFRDEKYGVVDVAVSYEGSTIWLAIEQRAQFLSILDRNQGSADALIATIECRTQKLLGDEEMECEF